MPSQISIHALLAESDASDERRTMTNTLFLSTLSLRRATDFRRTSKRPVTDFYPRSPCGERPLTLIIGFLVGVFLSTLSLRRATVTRVASTPTTVDFYPRSPCGERRPNGKRTSILHQISIHALLAESDLLSIRNTHNFGISIHALLAESDH